MCKAEHLIVDNGAFNQEVFECQATFFGLLIQFNLDHLFQLFLHQVIILSIWDEVFVSQCLNELQNENFDVFRMDFVLFLETFETALSHTEESFFYLWGHLALINSQRSVLVIHREHTGEERHSVIDIQSCPLINKSYYFVALLFVLPICAF